jgi:hypothetical protein
MDSNERMMGEIQKLFRVIRLAVGTITWMVILCLAYCTFVWSFSYKDGRLSISYLYLGAGVIAMVSVFCVSRFGTGMQINVQKENKD